MPGKLGIATLAAMNVEHPMKIAAALVPLLIVMLAGLGATALSIGAVILFAARGEAVVHALPYLAISGIDWLFFGVGMVLLVISGMSVSVSFRRARSIRRGWNGGNEPTKGRTHESTVLKPPGSKILRALLGMAVGAVFPALGFAYFLMRPSMPSALCAAYFFCLGFIVLVDAVKSISCRVEILEKGLLYWSWFSAKAMPVVEIRSARYGGYRTTTTLTVFGDKRWFQVSSDSFEPAQMEAIRKFCDEAAEVYPDWSS